MGRLQVEYFKHLTREEFKILTAVEVGMFNHELVEERLILSIAQMGQRVCRKLLSNLCRMKLLAFSSSGKKCIVLHENGFPVPRPVDSNRNAIVMELLDDIPLCQVHSVPDVEAVYSDCMDLIVRLAEAGIIHSDFNEFNVMVDSVGRITLIDFPQMVSTSHMNAQMRKDNLDCLVAASGFTKKISAEFSAMMDDLGDAESDNHSLDPSDDDCVHDVTVAEETTKEAMCCGEVLAMQGDLTSQDSTALPFHEVDNSGRQLGTSDDAEHNDGEADTSHTGQSSEDSMRKLIKQRLRKEQMVQRQKEADRKLKKKSKAQMNNKERRRNAMAIKSHDSFF